MFVSLFVFQGGLTYEFMSLLILWWIYVFDVRNCTTSVVFHWELLHFFLTHSREVKTATFCKRFFITWSRNNICWRPSRLCASPFNTNVIIFTFNYVLKFCLVFRYSARFLFTLTQDFFFFGRGSPLFWIGVGVGLSVVFTWVRW